jgi:hypothetical protein
MQRSFVRTGLWPSLTALTLGVALFTHCGDAGPTPPAPVGSPDSLFASAANPINATVATDTTHAATAIIDWEGGTIAATGADGTTYTLDIPPGALDDSATITLTPISSMTGVPGNGLVAGVQMSPDGLEFNEDATLTIEPAKPIPVDQQTMIGYLTGGTDVHLATPATMDASITMIVDHFSGKGIVSGGSAVRADIIAHHAVNEAARLDGEIGAFAQGERSHAVLGTQDDNTPTGPVMEDYFHAYHDNVIEPLVLAATLDCQHGVLALQSVLKYQRRATLYNFELGSADAADLDKAVTALKDCPFRAVPTVGLVEMTGTICSLDKTFSLTMNSEVFFGDPAFPTTKMNFFPSTLLNGTASFTGSDPHDIYTGTGTYQVLSEKTAYPAIILTQTICDQIVGGDKSCAPGANPSVKLKRVDHC